MHHRNIFSENFPEETLQFFGGKPDGLRRIGGDDDFRVFRRCGCGNLFLNPDLTRRTFRRRSRQTDSQ